MSGLFGFGSIASSNPSPSASTSRVATLAPDNPLDGSDTPAVNRMLSISTSDWGLPGLSISRKRMIRGWPTKPAFAELLATEATYVVE
ncbi:MAG: hypothetical protein EBQ51_01960 [Verrucomicrobia bacterium]|nr:hypothetical protein [Verrucomicrobiota bacterium]